MNVKSCLTALALLSIFSIAAPAASAAPVADYSGEYLCKGNNITVGDYEVTIYLRKNRRNSTAQVSVYDLVTLTENKQQSYTGQAITRGRQLAMTFKLSDAKYAEFSTGLGQFTKVGKLWSFKNDYYEPDDTGGNYGHETCKLKPAVATPAAKTTAPAKTKQ